MSTPQPRVIGALDQVFLTNDPDVTELILVRHGQQDVDYANAPKVADLVDPPLSAVGERQAVAVGNRFAGQTVDVVIASPLLRAWHTGMAIAGHHGLTPIENVDVREVETWRHAPRDQSMMESLGKERMLGQRARMARELRWDVNPYSESSQEFRNRVITAIEGIAAVHHGKRVVIACHGGVVNCYVGSVLGIAQDMWFRPAHTAVSVVKVGSHGRRSLITLGDIHHLELVDPALVTF
jgi:2,3-bisphosphoglycerate-dependent phosphoglycerate mutase